MQQSSRDIILIGPSAVYKHKHNHNQLSCMNIPFLSLYQSQRHFDVINSLTIDGPNIRSFRIFSLLYLNMFLINLIDNILLPNSINRYVHCLDVSSALSQAMGWSLFDPLANFLSEVLAMIKSTNLLLTTDNDSFSLPKSIIKELVRRCPYNFYLSRVKIEVCNSLLSLIP